MKNTVMRIFSNVHYKILKKGFQIMITNIEQVSKMLITNL